MPSWVGCRSPKPPCTLRRRQRRCRTGPRLPIATPHLLASHKAGLIHPEWLRGHQSLVGGRARFIISVVPALPSPTGNKSLGLRLGAVLCALILAMNACCADDASGKSRGPSAPGPWTPRQRRRPPFVSVGRTVPRERSTGPVRPCVHATDRPLVALARTTEKLASDPFRGVRYQCPTVSREVSGARAPRAEFTRGRVLPPECSRHAYDALPARPPGTTDIEPPLMSSVSAAT